MDIETLTKQRDDLLLALREIRGMADCMDMVRQELIEAGVIDQGTAPMFIANAVVAKLAQARTPAANAAGLTLAILTLGGIDGNEYDDNDIEIASSVRLEELQRELVRTSEPVVLELIARPAAEKAGGLRMENDGKEPDWEAYEALEREHLGDIDKQTGIYHPDNKTAMPCDLIVAKVRVVGDGIGFTDVRESILKRLDGAPLYARAADALSSNRAPAADAAGLGTYTKEIGIAGDRYLYSFKGAHPLPAEFLWEHLWDAMRAAAVGAAGQGGAV